MSADADDNTSTNSDEGVQTKDQRYSEDEIKEIRKLREEAKNYRLKNKEISTEFELHRMKSEEALKNITEEREKLKSEISRYSSYEKKLIETEIKAQAVMEGIKDTDLIKLIDTSDIKVSENGEVDTTSILERVKSLKEKKPFLFGSERVTSTSSNASVSKKSKNVPFDALTASKEEYLAGLQKLKKGQI